MNKNKRAVVLASGGADSSTLLKYLEKSGYELYILSFQYGQRHSIETVFLKNFLESIKYNEHKVAEIDLKIFGGSALTDQIDVPEHVHIKNSIPITYVPARNTIFLSYALAYAETIAATNIFIGIYSTGPLEYPDCQPKFINDFNVLAKSAVKPETAQKLIIRAPFMSLTKTEIIKLGLEIGIDYSKTLSCYNPNELGYACGKCSACFSRLKAFNDLNITDPAKYI